MRNQRGFTLIELIVVIVILGILAATALPRFVNLQADARAAKMNGALGAVRSAASLSRAAYLVGNNASSVTIEGSLYTLTNGYPRAGDIANLAGLDCSGSGQYTCSATGSGTGTGVATIKVDATTTTCQITYTETNTANTPPTYSAPVTASNC